MQLPPKYAIVYTVAPNREPSTISIGDKRLARLLDALQPAPRRFVYLSTTGVYGDHQGALVNEAAATHPSTPRAHARLQAEQQLTRWCANTGTDLVVLRVAGIYGPDRLGEDRLRAGFTVIDEADAHPGNRIHVDDLVRCCQAALIAPAGVYNIADSDQRSGTWFLREVALQAGIAEPQSVSRAVANETFSVRRLSFLADSRRIDTQKMRDELGVVPDYVNAEDGIKASLEMSDAPQG